MRQPGADRRRVLASILACLALIAVALAVWAQATGGFRVYVLGVPLSVRGALRPTLAALAFGVTSLHLFRAWRSPAVRTVVAELPRAAPWVAVLVALTTLGVGLLYGSRVASASDPSGYVSQADLWLKGDLKVPQPPVGEMPWPEREWTFSPLGYRPAADGMLVPTYAPGLPLLMAAARLVAGDCGPYLLGPLCAALLVWTTYSLGARISGRIVALIAALALAVSPTLVFMMMQPMSDVPAALFWTLSLLFAIRSHRRRDVLLAGVMAGIAICIRPNLAPLAAAPLLLTLWMWKRGWRAWVQQAALFAAGCTPFVLLVATVFNHLYGSPFRSGYGSLEENYSLANGPLNLVRYPPWFLETQGPVAFAFLLTPLVAIFGGPERRAPRLLLFAFVIAVFGCYLFYVAFNDWWYLRFLLPAFPFVFILAGDAVSTLAARVGPVARGVALVMFAGAIVATGALKSAERDVIGIGQGERRYADAAQYVQAALPRGAVVMTMQHSGSLRYYSDKLPLRYDLVAPEWIDRAIEYFRRAGRPVYVLVDDWEVPVFAERFSGQNAGAMVRAQALAATPDGRVLLFATEAADAATSPVQMPRAVGCLPPALSGR